MNATTNADLRTLRARIERVTADSHRVLGHAARELATIQRTGRGNGRTYVATVNLPDGSTAKTPAYRWLDDAVDAVLAPHLADERGEKRWAFPDVHANDWMHEAAL